LNVSSIPLGRPIHQVYNQKNHAVGRQDLEDKIVAVELPAIFLCDAGSWPLGLTKADFPAKVKEACERRGMGGSDAIAIRIKMPCGLDIFTTERLQDARINHLSGPMFLNPGMHIY
ncbi:hypothetical protein V5O48_017884, partial [Marasmius crinis-equi]